MSMPCRNILLVLAVALISADVSIALSCFSCYGSGPNTKCEDYQTYENALKENDEKKEEDTLLKPCIGPFNETCYIETYFEQGTVISHIRDCGDGKTFTFNNDEEKEPFYNRLRSMTMNNETVCVFDLKYMVCLSMCDTDFCNGPSKAAGLGFSAFVSVLCLTFVYVVKSVQFSNL